MRAKYSNPQKLGPKWVIFLCKLDSPPVAEMNQWEKDNGRKRMGEREWEKENGRKSMGEREWEKKNLRKRMGVKLYE